MPRLQPPTGPCTFALEDNQPISSYPCPNPFPLVGSSKLHRPRNITGQGSDATPNFASSRDEVFVGTLASQQHIHSVPCVLPHSPRKVSPQILCACEFANLPVSRRADDSKN